MPGRRSIVISVLSCLFVAAAVDGLAAQEAPGQPSSTPAKTEQSANLSEVVKLIVAKTNEFRQEQGRAAVKTNPLLTETVREFAAFMARTDKFGHEADGKQPSDGRVSTSTTIALLPRISPTNTARRGSPRPNWRQGSSRAGRNRRAIARTCSIPTSRRRASPSPTSEKSGKYYAVAMFGRPRSAAIEFSIKNETDAEVKYQIGDEDACLARVINQDPRAMPICRGEVRVVGGGRAAPDAPAEAAATGSSSPKKQASSAFARKSVVMTQPAKQEPQENRSILSRVRGLISVVFRDSPFRSLFPEMMPRPSGCGPRGGWPGRRTRR